MCQTNKVDHCWHRRNAPLMICIFRYLRLVNLGRLYNRLLLGIHLGRNFGGTFVARVVERCKWIVGLQDRQVVVVVVASSERKPSTSSFQRLSRQIW